jgi:cytochrome b561
LRYGLVSRLFHWVTVVLVLVLIPVGFLMVQDIPKPLQDRLFILHKGLGPVVLLVVVLRLLWRLFNPPPPLPAELPAVQRMAATAVHIGLYAVLLVMGVSGYVFVTTGGFPLEFLQSLGLRPLFAKNEPVADVAEAIHTTVIWGLLVLIAMHVGAAAYHGIVRRDGVVSRMWPPFGRPSD